MDLECWIEKKSRGKGGLWQRRFMTYSRGANQFHPPTVSYFQAHGGNNKAKQNGQVVVAGWKDVPDRKGKHQNRLDFEEEGSSSPLCVSFMDPATKAECIRLLKSTPLISKASLQTPTVNPSSMGIAEAVTAEIQLERDKASAKTDHAACQVSVGERMRHILYSLGIDAAAGPTFRLCVLGVRC